MIFSHHLQYPPGTNKIYSYFESRGGKFDKTGKIYMHYYTITFVYKKALIKHFTPFFFCWYKITFVNSQYKNTNSKGDLVGNHQLVWNVRFNDFWYTKIYLLYLTFVKINLYDHLLIPLIFYINISSSFKSVSLSSISVFFGLQYILKKWLVGQVVTQAMIDQADAILNKHFSGKNIFNKEGKFLIYINLLW